MKKFCNYFSALGILKYHLGISYLYDSAGNVNSIDYFFKMPAIENANGHPCYKTHSDRYGWCVRSASTGRIILTEKPR